MNPRTLNKSEVYYVMNDLPNGKLDSLITVPELHKSGFYGREKKWCLLKGRHKAFRKRFLFCHPRDNDVNQQGGLPHPLDFSLGPLSILLNP